MNNQIYDYFLTIILVHIVGQIVLKCVLQYFEIFKYCWTTILQAFVTMICAYIDFLKILVVILSLYPTCKYATICVFISLFFVTLMIYIIFKYIRVVH